jgi:long-chain acyl-CoA synthetase
VVVLSPSARSAAKADIERSLSDTLIAVNQTLEAHEKLDRVAVVTDEWTIENELLTPTMKIKRDLLEAKYERLISGSHAGNVQWEDSQIL